MNKLISFSLAALLAGASVGAQAAPRDGYDNRGPQQYQRYDRDDRDERRYNRRQERRAERYHGNVSGGVYYGVSGSGGGYYGGSGAGGGYYGGNYGNNYGNNYGGGYGGNYGGNYGGGYGGGYYGGNQGYGGQYQGYRPQHGGHGYRRHVYPAPAYYVRPHGYRPHRWSHGNYLPRPYYGSSYYVDYRPYQLARPPYGHRWVRVDNDVLLVALTTGLIADAVYGLFH